MDWKGKALVRIGGFCSLFGFKIKIELYGCHWCHSAVEKTFHRNWKCICHRIYQEKEGPVLNLIALKSIVEIPVGPVFSSTSSTCALDWDHHFFKVRMNIYANQGG